MRVCMCKIVNVNEWNNGVQVNQYSLTNMEMDNFFVISLFFIYCSDRTIIKRNILVHNKFQNQSHPNPYSSDRKNKNCSRRGVEEKLNNNKNGPKIARNSLNFLGMSKISKYPPYCWKINSFLQKNINRSCRKEGIYKIPMLKFIITISLIFHKNKPCGHLQPNYHVLKYISVTEKDHIMQWWWHLVHRIST